MKRWLRPLLWSSLVCLAGSCVGGQTGQPSPASCDDVPVPAMDKWGDLTVAEHARVFEGHYRATLAWFEEPVTSPTQTPVVLDDSIVIDVAYQAADAAKACGGSELRIPMQVDVSTTASAMHESGIGQLLLTSPAPSAASLELQGAHATIHLLLPGVATGASPSGTVVPTEGGAPGGWAEFPAPASAAGAGGAAGVGDAGAGGAAGAGGG